MQPVPVISLTNVSRAFILGDERIDALSNVSLSINRGEYVAIMGASGSGKSTLMNVIGCLDQPTSGNYHLEGRDTTGMSENDLADVRSRRIGFVFQSFNLLPRATALQNVVRPLVYQQVTREQRETIAREALMRVSLGHRQNHLPGQLSGGQRQRVAIARALCTRPALLVADEPTGNLDSTTTDEILSIFDDLNRSGTTIVLVTHEVAIAERCARVITLFDGRIERDDRVAAD